MTSLELSLEDFHWSGWIYTTRLERRIEKIQGEGQYKPYLQTLKKFNPGAYKHLRELVRTALWKSKFKRYYNNIIDYFKKK